MKRLGILVFFDKDGIVDPYVTYLLRELASVTEAISVVSNCSLNGVEESKLLEYTDKVYYRRNEGYDSGAFKHMIIDMLGREYVESFEELILVNDTFFGPLIPMTDIFLEMNDRECDFWGLLKHHATDSIPDHIQSYFLVARLRLLHSDCFWDYWDSLETKNDYSGAIETFEFSFTRIFTRNGFVGDTYVDTDHLKNPTHSLNYNLWGESAGRLVEQLHVPVVKKKVFSYPLLTDEAMRILTYVDRNTDYDVNLIWDHILRVYNYMDISNTIKPYFVIPSDKLVGTNAHSATCLVIVYAYQELDIESLAKSLEGLDAKRFDIVIYTSSKLAHFFNDLDIQGVRIEITEEQHFPMRFLAGMDYDDLSNYDYLCFLNNELPVRRNVKFYEQEQQFDCFWRNLIASTDYLNNLLTRFLDNNRLGILYPATWSQDYGKDWNQKWREVNRALSDCGVSAHIDGKSMPPYFGRCFVCRIDAIRNLWKRDWSQIDFAISVEDDIQFMLPYIVQASGYYSGLAVGEWFAGLYFDKVGIDICTNKKLEHEIDRNPMGYDQLLAVRKENEELEDRLRMAMEEIKRLKSLM